MVKEATQFLLTSVVEKLTTRILLEFPGIKKSVNSLLKLIHSFGVNYRYFETIVKQLDVVLKQDASQHDRVRHIQEMLLGEMVARCLKSIIHDSWKQTTLAPKNQHKEPELILYELLEAFENPNESNIGHLINQQLTWKYFLTKETKIKINDVQSNLFHSKILRRLQKLVCPFPLEGKKDNIHIAETYQDFALDIQNQGSPKITRKLTLNKRFAITPRIKTYPFSPENNLLYIQSEQGLPGLYKTRNRIEKLLEEKINEIVHDPLDPALLPNYEQLVSCNQFIMNKSNRSPRNQKESAALEKCLSNIKICSRIAKNIGDQERVSAYKLKKADVLLGMAEGHFDQFHNDSFVWLFKAITTLSKMLRYAGHQTARLLLRLSKFAQTQQHKTLLASHALQLLLDPNHMPTCHEFQHSESLSESGQLKKLIHSVDQPQQIDSRLLLECYQSITFEDPAMRKWIELQSARASRAAAHSDFINTQETINLMRTIYCGETKELMKARFEMIRHLTHQQKLEEAVSELSKCIEICKKSWKPEITMQLPNCYLLEGIIRFRKCHVVQAKNPFHQALSLLKESESFQSRVVYSETLYYLCRCFIMKRSLGKKEPSELEVPLFPSDLIRVPDVIPSLQQIYVPALFEEYVKISAKQQAKNGQIIFQNIVDRLWLESLLNNELNEEPRKFPIDFQPLTLIRSSMRCFILDCSFSFFKIVHFLKLFIF